MKATDALFLICVAVAAALFVVASLAHTGTAVPSALPAVSDGAGRPRDLDINRVRKMIERGDLSDREAEFYREAPDAPQKESASPPG
ncbi:MAG TPA: hypothetical protein PLD73_02635 [Candidatus Hydrogenedentes bacterium]|jgi:hypothetical protein|nr:hypothetical protein [Candidatus Hydrogenedentota bacterium]HPJ98502.1 hypothetical protein [Candidatus Hydrogenedentota bacterium]